MSISKASRHLGEEAWMEFCRNYLIGLIVDQTAERDAKKIGEAAGFFSKRAESLPGKLPEKVVVMNYLYRVAGPSKKRHIETRQAIQFFNECFETFRTAEIAGRSVHVCSATSDTKPFAGLDLQAPYLYTAV